MATCRVFSQVVLFARVLGLTVGNKAEQLCEKMIVVDIAIATELHEFVFNSFSNFFISRTFSMADSVCGRGDSGLVTDYKGGSNTFFQKGLVSH